MRIADTQIYADHFAAGAELVLVSHYHRDHLRGIERRGSRATTICTPLTARLLAAFEGVDAECLCPLEIGARMDVRVGSRTVAITALEANHCLGAAMFRIEWDTLSALYTGDFRLNDTVRAQAAAHAGVDLLYLDTTYDDPRYRFPPVELAVEQVLSLMRKREGKEVYLAVYSIGKSRILEAAVSEFGLPFYTTKDKRRIYETVGKGHLVTSDREATPFRAYARGYLEHYFRMTRRFRDGDYLAIIPTGWALDQSGPSSYHYVPYSEHCDYEELREFVELVHPGRVIAINT